MPSITWHSHIDIQLVTTILLAVHTMSELKMTGNALKGSRPILNFDSKFDELPHLQLLKELFFQTFATPRAHPKSKPFVDRVMTFAWLDNRVWFRNYQVSITLSGVLAWSWRKT
jgi:hypothetical protein